MSPHGDDPRPLGGDARALLDSARPLERLPAGHKARLKGRVMAAVAVSAAASAAASAAEAAAAQTAGASAAKVAGLSLLAKAGLGVAVVTIGAGGWVWMQVREHSAARPVAAAVAAPIFVDSEEAEPAPASPAAAASNEIPAVVVEAPSAPSAVAVEAPGAPPAVNEPSAPVVVSHATVVVSGEPVADSLQDETKLLSAAHAALSQGNAAAALGLLDAHAAKFPRGALVPERRAARAMALCRLGRSDEGRREAEALYGKGSKSPLAEKIDRACTK